MDDCAEIVLINPYELGRQPFGLAEPAAWLRDAGFSVQCVDLSQQSLSEARLGTPILIAFYVAMHTATRIAMEAIPRMRLAAPGAHLCVYGLYASVNNALFRDLGVETVFGGEFEPDLLALAQQLRAGQTAIQQEAVVNLGKIEFRVPDRSGLPALEEYAHLQLGDGATKTMGFAEGTRGCKHLCRHCPVVPVYQGRFRIVPVPTVMADIRQQVAAGAQHISFGDPDFLNGPTHARRLVHAFAEEFPELTFDATVKVEHIIKHRDMLGELRAAGCLFLTSAVEAVDDEVLTLLAKNHTAEDFEHAVTLLRRAGIAMAPTFMPFTPWTSVAGYVHLLARLVDLNLVHNVPPIQLAIRMLVPQGSYLFQLDGFASLVDDFDRQQLGYPWRHPDPNVDQLQIAVQTVVEQGERDELAREMIFTQIWNLAHQQLGVPAPALLIRSGELPPRHSEPWYCCAEPTSLQLEGL